MCCGHSSFNIFLSRFKSSKTCTVYWFIENLVHFIMQNMCTMLKLFIMFKLHEIFYVDGNEQKYKYYAVVCKKIKIIISLKTTLFAVLLLLATSFME